MVNYWVCQSTDIAYITQCGLRGEYFLDKRVAQRMGKKMRPGDKAVIYQVRNPAGKAEQCFIGTFTIASEVYYRYSDKQIFVEIKDFNLWRYPVNLNEIVDELETVPPPGDPWHARGAVRGPISSDDYWRILAAYGGIVESHYQE